MFMAINFSLQFGNWQFAVSLGRQKPQQSCAVAGNQQLKSRLAPPHCKPKVLLSDGVRAKCRERSISCSTADNCRTAEMAFRKYLGGKDMDLGLLTQEMVRGFEKWMCRDGLKPNTRSCYMASLRSVYNRAVKHRRIKNRHPFACVHIGHTKTGKRSFPAAMVKRISQLELVPGSRLCLARDMFLFSVCAQGMAFVDMASIRYSQIKGEKIEYFRWKTGNMVRVDVSQQMREIMKKYKHEGSDRIFPIITSDIPEVANRQYRSALGYHNSLLKKIGAMVGMDTSLTSYVSRHTWASLSYSLDVPLSVISQGMGHSSTAVTGTYIRELDDDRVTEANKKVLNAIFVVPIGNRCTSA